MCCQSNEVCAHIPNEHTAPIRAWVLNVVWNNGYQLPLLLNWHNKITKHWESHYKDWKALIGAISTSSVTSLWAETYQLWESNRQLTPPSWTLSEKRIGEGAPKYTTMTHFRTSAESKSVRAECTLKLVAIVQDTCTHDCDHAPKYLCHQFYLATWCNTTHDFWCWQNPFQTFSPLFHLNSEFWSVTHFLLAFCVLVKTNLGNVNSHGQWTCCLIAALQHNGLQLFKQSKTSTSVGMPIPHN